MRPVPALAAVVLTVATAALSCSRTRPADLVLTGGRIYSLDWAEPGPDGQPAAGSPHGPGGWHPDAEAIAVRDGEIVFVGSQAEAARFQGPATRVRDLEGATVLPGLIDSHVHLDELGASLERVDLVGVTTEAEAVARVVERAASTPPGEWIVGWGWDEGAWANHYPDMRLLSERVPDHPVVLRGLHSFAVWGNALAFARAGITTSSANPAGGEIVRDPRGRPTGILLNSAGTLLTAAVPPPTPDQLAGRIGRALGALADGGYVAVHEAGADRALLSVLESMDRDGKLPVRVYAMLAARDPDLVDEWLARGPRTDAGQLVVRSVKAFYDGAMGSRGAYFLDDYSDQPGRRGRGGADYGFDAARLETMMRAGFQMVVHAIGDRANRETLDLVERVTRDVPQARETRPRIEHAQVVSAEDLPRFASLGVIASMQPSHAVEDMAWAEARVGPERITGAYAWRSLRLAGARLALSSDLPGTDFDFFYGLHSAVTRQNRDGEPAGGWRPSERLSIEEAIRGWTTWAAYAGFEEGRAGVIASGRPADLTVVDIDPFQVGETDPGRLLDGHVRFTIAGGRAVGLRPDPPIACSACDEWNRPFEPFRVFGDTYYVGTEGLSAVLLASPAGHILLDGGLPQSAPLIVRNIGALGFDAADVRLVLSSHGHFDHAGGIAALERVSGATVAASESGARALEAGAPVPDDPQVDYHGVFPTVGDVRRVADGETLKVGPLAVTAHLTPGHTPGSTTWTWQSCEAGRCVNVVYADSLNAVSAPGFRFSRPAELADRFRRSIATVEALPCDVLIAVHPSFGDLSGKRTRQMAGDPAAFIDPGACRAYAVAARDGLDRRLASEK